MQQSGWAIGVGIIIVALSVSKAVPALVRAFAERLLAGQREGERLAKPLS